MQRVFLVNVSESWLELHKLFGLNFETKDCDNEEAWFKFQAINAQRLLKFMRGKFKLLHKRDESYDVSFIMYGYTGGETFQHRPLQYSVVRLIMEMVSTVTARMKKDFKTIDSYSFNENTIDKADSEGSNTTLQQIRNIGFIYDIDKCWITLEGKFTGEADFHFKSATSVDWIIWNQVQSQNIRQVQAFMLRKLDIRTIYGVLNTQNLPPKYAMLSNLIRVVSQVRTKLLRRPLPDEISSEDRANTTKVLKQIQEFKVEKPSREEIYKDSIKRIRNLVVQNAIAKITNILGLMELLDTPQTTNGPTMAHHKQAC